MDKLIELLNEYEKKTVVHWYEWYGEDVLMCRYIKDNFEFYTDEATTIAISKYYGFIKWLVDNDKINREGMKGHGRLISYCLYIKSWEWDKIKEGVLLMLLAISDTPIDDLISYLK